VAWCWEEGENFPAPGGWPHNWKAGADPNPALALEFGLWPVASFLALIFSQQDPPQDREDKWADVCAKCFSKDLSNGVLGIVLFLFESGEFLQD